jgi:DNA polymerase-3 subunit delta
MPKVTTAKLEKDIKDGAVSPVYYFTGDDAYRKLEFVKQIKTAIAPDEFNFMKEDGGNADMGELISIANTAPVFSAKRMIVLNNADKIKKNSKAYTLLQGYLAAPLETTCLIVMHNDSKKSKKDKSFENACSDICAIVNFEPLESAQLAAWAAAKFKERGLKMDNDAFITLEDSAGSDLTALNTEIEKLSLYLEDREDKTVREADVLASIGFSKEENPFALSNAVLNCDKTLSLKLVTAMLESGEEPVGILNKISACVVKMLRIKRLSDAGLGQYDIISAAGLLPWEGKLVTRAGSYPGKKTLVKTLDKIIETDMALKSSTSSDPGIMIKGILLTLFAR